MGLLYGLGVWAVATAAAVLALRFLRTKREYLSGCDSVFVSGDPFNVIVVHALISTKTPLPFADFKEVVNRYFACHARFRQRIIKRVWKWHYFQAADDFQLERHIKTHKLPVLANPTEDALQAQLEDYMSELQQTPVDMRHPPWEFILIERHGSGSVFFFRVHHSITDGVTLMRLAMTGFTKTPERYSESGEAATLEAPATETIQMTSPGLNQSPTPIAAVRARSASPAVGSAAAKSSKPAGFVALQRYKKPRSSRPRNPLTVAAQFAKSVVKTLFMRADPVSRFKPATILTPDTPCKAGWIRHSFDLGEMKQLSYATGTSVNDIIFCVVSAALRKYCLLRKEKEPLLDINSIMWVSMQGTEVKQEIGFGNKIGAVTLPLPLSVSDDLDRLVAVRDMTSSLQVSPDPYVAQMLLMLLGLLPQGLTRAVWAQIAYKATNSMSNVPGPQHSVSVCGHEVDRLVFFVPPQGTIASFISILSYNGQVQMGFLADTRVVDKPHEVLNFFTSEYEALREQVDKLQRDGQLQARLKLLDKYKA